MAGINELIEENVAPINVMFISGDYGFTDILNEPKEKRL